MLKNVNFFGFLSSLCGASGCRVFLQKRLDIYVDQCYNRKKCGKPLLHILTADRAVIDTTYLMMLYFVPFYITWVLIEVLSAVLRGVGDAVRPVIIIGLGVCLLRIIWVGTLFVARHTLFVLCMCYPVSWIVTGLAMLVYYLRGSWRGRMALVLDR